jgi:hypothetical protein
MAEWRVNLQGDELDLEELATRLTSPGQRKMTACHSRSRFSNVTVE